MYIDSLMPLALQFEAVLVDSPQDIEIDAHLLEHIDGAGLQLLYAFARDARQMGKRITWTGMSPQIADQAALLGMQDMLGLGR